MTHADTTEDATPDTDVDVDAAAAAAAETNFDTETNSDTESNSDTAVQEPEDLATDSVAEEDTDDAATEESEVFNRWANLQIRFVKDPQAAVAEAHSMIDEIVEARRKAFDEHRASITGRWQGVDADTEALRLILQDYRKVLRVLFPRQG